MSFMASWAAWRRAGDAELFERVPHLDVVVGTQKYHRVFDYVDSIAHVVDWKARMDEVGARRW